MTAPTPVELRETLMTLAAGVTETRAARWEELVGEVEVLPIAFHPRCNWRVEVGGVGNDREVLDAAVELLRREHPYVTGEVSPGWHAGA